MVLIERLLLLLVACIIAGIVRKMRGGTFLPPPNAPVPLSAFERLQLSRPPVSNRLLLGARPVKSAVQGGCKTASFRFARETRRIQNCAIPSAGAGAR
jgi:hypothetical protein